MEFKNNEELNKAVLKFMKDNSGFIHLCIKSIAIDHEMYKDLEQDTFMILRRWLPRYNEKSGLKPITYIGECLKLELCRYRKKYNKLKLPDYVYIYANKYTKDPIKYKDYEKYKTHVLNSEHSAALDAEINITQTEIKKGYRFEFSNIEIDRELDNKDICKAIKYWIKYFPGDEGYVLYQYYFNNKRLVDIAKELGCCAERVRNVKVRALERLKSRVTNYYANELGDALYD